MMLELSSELLLLDVRGTVTSLRENMFLSLLMSFKVWCLLFVIMVLMELLMNKISVLYYVVFVFKCDCDRPTYKSECL